MNSPISGSESSSFEQLHPGVQQWVWSQGWTSLRDAQEWAIPALINADRDVIIAASTAAGKTEAAFLPILTNLLLNQEPAGAVLYISPLKALINDQWDRLTRLCERLEVPVVAWHGDVSASRKHRFLTNPNGILLITPESLEALFVNRGSALKGLFQQLRYVVVDELHAFIGSERGKQLQSLMQRVEQVADRQLPRVGLSATLGEMSLARKFLRPSQHQPMEVIESKSSGQDLQVQVRGYTLPPMIKLLSEQQTAEATDSKDGEAEDESGSRHAIAAHLYKVLRGSNNLIFPNSRDKVEWYADRLRHLCEKDGLPNEFLPHHGSLSRDLREDTERALKAGAPPASAICTTTLELGIDIGNIRTVAQINAPPSVASLRQRLGRSGRREGEPATLRAYCEESALRPDSSLSDQLRQNLVQTIAMIRLLLKKWFEPPRTHGLHASTLVQQCLSVIAQQGGASASELWTTLIASGTFPAITQADFLALLKALGEKKLVVQDSSGLLLPGEIGERLVNHYEFYSAFQSDEEFRLIRDGKPLGSVPVSRPLAQGQRIIFGGRRWQVVDIDVEKKVIIVLPARGGEPPTFDGLGAKIHDDVRQEMLRVLKESTHCPFIDSNAQKLLEEARQTFRSMRLDKQHLTGSASRYYLLTWKGDYVNDALSLLLNRAGVTCECLGLALEIGASRASLMTALSEIARLDPDDVVSLLKDVKNPIREKWDWALPAPLLLKSFASSQLDLKGAIELARMLSLSDSSLAVSPALDPPSP
ncbi:ATP-dependent helicase Lhr and Lhr-like helicase [Pseudomonas asturiensis]|uniref:ATP-dependent helicase Lhr and Lhr-like helicase n=1 Tax=Pseudomonas asturiensis TaxID=1190415 RepID=A0A1M7KZ54_9PSED|nr:DEAD/DEAH box helicase [Pseudomonas asturiensis]SHM70908.1 ATP-dependent helicase Lhr and Lhr-like helicase [Pseudomonas asturiensis]